MSFSPYVHRFLLGICVQEKLLENRLCLHSTKYNAFPKWLCQFYSWSALHKRSHCFISSPKLGNFNLFTYVVVLGFKTQIFTLAGRCANT
jgi:hypothetical protein